MLKFLPILALSTAAVCQSAAAPRFSFASWVEDIIADPDGDHLSAEEAVAAFYASAPSGAISRASNLFGLQRDDVSCNEVTKTEAPIPDAVACIQQIAGQGTAPCRVNTYNQFCKIGRAMIDGNSGHDTTSYCVDVARGAGYIMDACSRADNSVEGSGYVNGNGDILMRIHNTDG